MSEDNLTVRGRVLKGSYLIKEANVANNLISNFNKVKLKEYPHFNITLRISPYNPEATRKIIDDIFRVQNFLYSTKARGNLRIEAAGEYKNEVVSILKEKFPTISKEMPSILILSSEILYEVIQLQSYSKIDDFKTRIDFFKKIYSEINLFVNLYTDGFTANSSKKLINSLLKAFNKFGNDSGKKITINLRMIGFKSTKSGGTLRDLFLNKLMANLDKINNTNMSVRIEVINKSYLTPFDHFNQNDNSNNNNNSESNDSFSSNVVSTNRGACPDWLYVFNSTDLIRASERLDELKKNFSQLNIILVIDANSFEISNFFELLKACLIRFDDHDGFPAILNLKFEISGEEMATRISIIESLLSLKINNKFSERILFDLSGFKKELQMIFTIIKSSKNSASLTTEPNPPIEVCAPREVPHAVIGSSWRKIQYNENQVKPQSNNCGGNASLTDKNCTLFPTVSNSNDKNFRRVIVVPSNLKENNEEETGLQNAAFPLNNISNSS